MKVFDRCLSYGQEKNPESMDFQITFDYEFLEDVYAKWITHNIHREAIETGSEYASSTGGQICCSVFLCFALEAVVTVVAVVVVVDIVLLLLLLLVLLLL